MESKVLISGNYSFNVKQTTAGAHGSGVNIYLYGCASLVIPMCVVCLCVCVFLCVLVISNQSSSKKPHVSDLGKLDTYQNSSGVGINIYSRWC